MMTTEYPLNRSLGANYNPEQTEFAVWSPKANNVDLILYEPDPSQQNGGQVVKMNQDQQGVWSVTVHGNQKNKLYNYIVEIDNEIKCAVDPYAKAVIQNGHKGVVVDLAETNPVEWEKDQKPPLVELEDSILYEMHVKDFSISPHSGMEHKGKFLAFTEEGTTIPKTEIKTGIAHLKELGITHIHLLPIFDFATVDESVDYQYNWGYDPQNYNVPEGSYARDSANPLVRIREAKEMVKSLHRNGIRVVMDVVYNHTYETINSNFGKLAPEVYYRFDEHGNYSNGSGCGNEIASEHPMVRKFIIDSVKYWAQEYHIDGFRFDLMALHDQETMELLAQELKKIDPSILIYGEPWTADLSPLPIEKQMKKGVQQESGVAVFNDDFRDALKGSTRGEDRGYVSGKLDEETIEKVKVGIMGGIDSFSFDPEEAINYVSAHDDLTLWDKIKKSNPDANREDKVRMNNLANAIVLTSQGIPFLHGGVEFLRTKYGVENSYNYPDAINQLEWERKVYDYETFEYYQGLIELRREHPAFRMNTADQIKKYLQFLDSPEGVIAYQLQEHANGDLWEEIIVIYNPYPEAQQIFLPTEGSWKIVVADQQAGVETLEVLTDKQVIVPRISTMVLYK
ncbi:type I pullulanase [Natroniella sulfidigena]|uniref:type I pullulanase n=1 Tax=Natroniella sulfidigena TaxID=723921 RepID=UPI00200B6622|nr:type I pullulanase [Natroniella sulfidigena]MCK8816259.1 type I pullulanase [Natroniella sulfidigena]